MQASRILDGQNSDEPIEVVLPCNNGTSLIFEYKPDQNNQMSAYLTINKNNETIRFRFKTTEYEETVNGQTVTKVMQTDLSIFTLILGCYLLGKAIIRHIDRNDEAYNQALLLMQEQMEQERQQEVFAAGGNNQS